MKKQSQSLENAIVTYLVNTKIKNDERFDKEKEVLLFYFLYSVAFPMKPTKGSFLFVLGRFSVVAEREWK